MKSKLIFGLALVLSGILFGCSTQMHQPSAAGVGINRNLTQQVSAVLVECQKIKPGMTRAELLKVFTTEGGLSTAEHRTFVYRRCPYIKVDVDFNISEPRQKVISEQSTDTIRKISKPYLDWSIAD